MRYIGSKQALLGRLSDEISKRVLSKGHFCDLFSGSACVARHFKREGYQISSNDIMNFSYFLQAATIELNTQPEFEKLGLNPIEYLNSIDPCNFSYSGSKFVTENYSPSSADATNYFTRNNAAKIDAVRQQIQQWFNEEKLSWSEFSYLVACLVEAVPFVSNTTGTYGAYLKKWDKRAFKDLTLTNLETFDNGLSNATYCEDANDLVKKLEGQILYIDPPYNGRQYGSNYHVLETIARYDYPEVKGITSMRDNSDVRSDFCIKSRVENALQELISTSNFEYIFLSYNTDGILSVEQIEQIFSENCVEGSIDLVRIPYRRYKRTKEEKNGQLNELLFSGKRK